MAEPRLRVGLMSGRPGQGPGCDMHALASAARAVVRQSTGAPSLRNPMAVLCTRALRCAIGRARAARCCRYACRPAFRPVRSRGAGSTKWRRAPQWSATLALAQSLPCMLRRFLVGTRRLSVREKTCCSPAGGQDGASESTLCLMR